MPHTILEYSDNALVPADLQPLWRELHPVLVATAGSFQALPVWLAFVGVNIIAMGTSAHLGILGSTLTHAAMPGDKIFMKKKKPAAKGAQAKTAAPKAPSEEKKE